MLTESVKMLQVQSLIELLESLRGGVAGLALDEKRFGEGGHATQAVQALEVGNAVLLHDGHQIFACRWEFRFVVISDVGNQPMLNRAGV
jgi:hypothetical protein